jgi:post-segregation antitoxin (ccd killing protein)
MKSKLTLSVETLLINMAKDSNINISEFVEKALANHFRIHKEVRWVSEEPGVQPIIVVDSLVDAETSN